VRTALTLLQQYLQVTRRGVHQEALATREKLDEAKRWVHPAGLPSGGYPENLAGGAGRDGTASSLARTGEAWSLHTFCVPC